MSAKPQPEKCSATTGSWQAQRCYIRAKVFVDGKGYCGIHDPAKRVQRAAAWREKWDRENAARNHSAALAAATAAVVEAAKERWVIEHESESMNHTDAYFADKDRRWAEADANISTAVSRLIALERG